jgi:NADH:ubiquinone oxidoreductase subunit E
LNAEVDLDKINKIADSYRNKESFLINILQDIQDEYNFLPKNILVSIEKKFKVPLSKIYSIATFYTAFSLKPKGKHQIKICLGTACFVKGGRKILERLKRELKIKSGQTTKDSKFSLETVRCLGCCGLSPVMMIDNKIYGHVSQDEIPKILKNYK